MTTKTWSIAAAAVLFCVLVYWIWAVLIPSRDVVMPDAVSAPGENLPVLQQNIIFTKPAEELKPQRFIPDSPKEDEVPTDAESVILPTID